MLVGLGVRFSLDTSVMIAMMVELAVRMLTKRPTVARTAEGTSRLEGNSPTRAPEPRTEITLPNAPRATASAMAPQTHR